ncbi:hypothetical protein CALVIDRAFT_238515 [Calocera viscosa TUFC12733]|uniref:Uncharacterized protein n=1 Tax=Calocera viscosa (strain TUFC12733) TaxID=1330018 RepID=A0A167JVE3_CALVF|nr:hypothetical protein CALVIDRAFT_238515 [Calocera viscosa TUFC12733]
MARLSDLLAYIKANATAFDFKNGELINRLIDCLYPKPEAAHSSPLRQPSVSLSHTGRSRKRSTARPKFIERFLTDATATFPLQKVQEHIHDSTIDAEERTVPATDVELRHTPASREVMLHGNSEADPVQLASSAPQLGASPDRQTWPSGMPSSKTSPSPIQLLAQAQSHTSSYAQTRTFSAFQSVTSVDFPSGTILLPPPHEVQPAGTASQPEGLDGSNQAPRAGSSAELEEQPHRLGFVPPESQGKAVQSARDAVSALIRRSIRLDSDNMSFHAGFSSVMRIDMKKGDLATACERLRKIEPSFSLDAVTRKALLKEVLNKLTSPDDPRFFLCIMVAQKYLDREWYDEVVNSGWLDKIELGLNSLSAGRHSNEDTVMLQRCLGGLERKFKDRGKNSAKEQDQIRRLKQFLDRHTSGAAHVWGERFSE